MNRLIAVLSLSGLTLATMSQAQVPSSPPAPQTIVTVSFNTAVLQTAEAKRELGALQSKLAPRQAQLQTLNNEVEGLRKQLIDAGTSSPLWTEKQKSGRWRRNRSSFSVRPKTSETIRRASLSRCFRKWHRRFTLSCRRIPSSTGTRR